MAKARAKTNWTAVRRNQYATKRALLILLMGSKCRWCGERRPWRLEFHHLVKSKNGHAGRTSRLTRLRRYMREWLDGECVLACGKCNKRLGPPPGRADEEPF